MKVVLALLMICAGGGLLGAGVQTAHQLHLAGDMPLSVAFAYAQVIPKLLMVAAALVGLGGVVAGAVGLLDRSRNTGILWALFLCAGFAVLVGGAGWAYSTMATELASLETGVTNPAVLAPARAEALLSAVIGLGGAFASLLLANLIHARPFRTVGG